MTRPGPDTGPAGPPAVASTGPNARPPADGPGVGAGPGMRDASVGTSWGHGVAQAGDGPRPVTVERPARADAVAAILRDLPRLDPVRALAPDRLEDLTILLGEVLNNVVEHALAQRPDATWRLTLAPMRGALRVTVEDGGVPLPPSLPHGAPLPNMDVDSANLPEGGFGWFIIHALADDMMYERIQGRNRLTFSIAPAA